MEWNNGKTTSFIDDYHNSPELWNNKISDYKDFKIKIFKLKQLANKYDCTVPEVKKKIKNLRSAFHRERKKLRGKKSGLSANKKSKWFAYDLLSFLLDVDLPKATLSTVVSDEEFEEEESVQAEVYESGKLPVYGVSSKHEKKSCKVKRENFIVPKRKRKVFSSTDRKEETYIFKNARQRDDCSIYGEHVANELRNLTYRARTIVKHKINNTLFEAAIGQFDASIDYTESSCSTVLSSENEQKPTLTIAPSLTTLHNTYVNTTPSLEPSTSPLSESQETSLKPDLLGLHFLSSNKEA